MCTRFSFPYQVRMKGLWGNIKDPKNLLPIFSPRYNIAPTDEALVVLEESNEPTLNKMIFGMIPHWAKDAKMGLKCLNARCETMAEKPSFRGPLKNRRCLIPADGFYEWKRDGNKKRPHRVVQKNREPFFFAGLWDEWTSPSGHSLRSFAIVTTEANSLLSTIHDRMPVILKEREQSLWLDSNVVDLAILTHALVPFPSNELEIYEVTPRMSLSSYKEADSVDPYEGDYPGLFNLDEKN